MSKPVATVLLRDAVAGAPRCLAQSKWKARGDAADVLLLKCPCGFDRVEVGGVRRQVDKANAVCAARGSDAGIVVCVEVVHDEHVTRPEALANCGVALFAFLVCEDNTNA